MKRFAQLYSELDGTNSMLDKRASLERYFRDADPSDAAWAVYFLTGNRPRQVVPSRRMFELAGAIAELPAWLMDECYEAVGDLAETVAHVLPQAAAPTEHSLTHWVEQRLLPLAGAPDDVRADALRRAWDELDGPARLVWNKLITGEFRVGVMARTVTRALGAIARVDPAVIAHRLAGAWMPSADSYRALVSPDATEIEASRPYPMFLAHALDAEPATLGAIGDWQIEWKWDGIRGQIIRRGGAAYVWSRGEELINDAFPDLVTAAAQLPDGTVLDGEIVVWDDGRAAPFNALQKRLGRKAPSRALVERAPAAFIAYDALEIDGVDIREQPLAARRAALDALLTGDDSRAVLKVSPVVAVSNWDALRALRADVRGLGVEGLMLKRRDSAYGVGRVRGPWWKWKVDPYTVDAVLMYAQRGHGRRASLYTDYTFGVWSDGALVPFAKAYSGLTDDEIRSVDNYIRAHTLEKIGPVRVVAPDIVCELAFEGLQRSARHKSGIAVRFPRIARLRPDKAPADADSLDALHALLGAPA
jgi:DNA ligase-1